MDFFKTIIYINFCALSGMLTCFGYFKYLEENETDYLWMALIFAVFCLFFLKIGWSAMLRCLAEKKRLFPDKPIAPPTGKMQKSSVDGFIADLIPNNDNPLDREIQKGIKALKKLETSNIGDKVGLLARAMNYWTNVPGAGMRGTYNGPLTVSKKILATLGRQRSERAYEIIKRYLYFEEGNLRTAIDMRASSVKSLAATGIPRALDDIVPLMQYDSTLVKGSVVSASEQAKALGLAIKGKAEFNEVEHMIERSYGSLRLAAVESLGILGRSEAIPFLQDALSDPDERVRAAARETIDKLKNQKKSNA